MAQGFFMVTPAELRTTAQNLRECNSNFRNQVSSLESSEGSLNSKWQGSAHDAFHTAFMNDKAYMDKFAAEIEKYCTTLENIAANYENAENTNLDTANTRRY